MLCFFYNLESGKINLDNNFAPELNTLQRILHFPEEVALLISDKENDIFYNVPPIDYLRQATLDQDDTNACCTSVHKLVERFNAVSSFAANFVFNLYVCKKKFLLFLKLVTLCLLYKY